MNALSLAYVADLALGVFLLALAALASRIPRPGPARWLLSAYFALVGLNYAADGSAYLLGVKDAGTPIDTVAYLARLFDPPTLLLFALALAGVRIRPAWALLAFVPSLVLLASPFEGVAGARLSPDRLLYTALLLVTYLGAFGVLVRLYLEAREPRARDAAGILVVAFSLICLTRVPLAWIDLALLPTGPAGRRSPGSLVLEATLLATLVAFGLLLRWRARGPAWRHARGVLVAAAGLFLVLAMEWLLRFVPHVQDSSFALIFAMRWLLFLAVVTAGLRRHELLGLPAAVAPWLRKSFAGLLLVVATGLAASLLRSLPGMGDLGALVGGAALVGVIAGALFALRLAMPGPPSEADWRRATVYRAHLALGASGRELERLRRQLDLPEREARDVEALFHLERQIPADASERLEPGRAFLGRYRVERVLGVGGFGRAYAAQDAFMGERVVLKELLPGWEGEPAALERFRREAETALRIRHPGLVGFRGLERAGAGHVLVLEYVEGETLAARLARGPLAEPEAARVARGLLSGLAELHRHGILHRDVKPENVMLRPDGHAVLLDFGAVTRKGGDTHLALGAHPGTPGYASPEQARGERLGPPSDVYAAGVLLWRALAGAAPPRGQVPDAWRPALEKAVSARPEERHADAAALLAALPV